jgi:hypothetical protein
MYFLNDDYIFVDTKTRGSFCTGAGRRPGDSRGAAHTKWQSEHRHTDNLCCRTVQNLIG